MKNTWEHIENVSDIIVLNNNDAWVSAKIVESLNIKPAKIFKKIENIRHHDQLS